MSWSALLLDDDKELRAIMAAALAAEGFEIAEAKTGREATATLAARATDVIIVDGLLPDGSGVDWIARLRAARCVTPVVFVSALFRDRAVFRRLTDELDVALVLYKPFSPADFAKRVRKLVDKSGAGVPSVAPPRPAVDLFADLRRDFAAKLPARIAELASAVDDARLDLSALPSARSLAHKLRGTGGSYGFAGVSEAAGRVDDLLGRAASTGRLIGGLADQIDRALSDLRVAPGQQPASAPAGSAAEPKGAALLVVDDDPEFLRLVREAARRTCVAVETANDARAALEIAHRRPLLGALLDLRLAGEASFGLATALRASPRHATTPIAFMSMDGAIETRIQAINAGGSRFFAKPLADSDLASLVQDFAAASEQARGKVFIVDDDPDAVRAYTSLLRDTGIHVDSIGSPQDVLDHLESRSPDLLLLDVELPRMSGLDVCRALRATARWELLPILMITARADAATRLQAFRAGASDVIIKPVLAEELLARVGVQLERARLVRARIHEDSLSGLMLRRSFVEALQRALSLAQRERAPLSVVMLDVDHFKGVNDRFGHATGDQVLARLGQLLRQRFRAEDLRGRWGGDELILAFPGQSSDIASRLVRQLGEELRRERFGSESGESFSVSLSAGVASYPESGASVGALIARADELLYLSKREGRDRVSSRVPAVAPISDPAAKPRGPMR